MPNEERPQDFELIELLIKEAGSVIGASAAEHPTQPSSEFKSFKARFLSYIDQIPSYLHSVNKGGFFPHFFLGSFSTLVDTEIATKLDIEKVYFCFDGPKTLKVAIIREGDIKGRGDAIDKIRLFVISEKGAPSATQKFSYGELSGALGRSQPARFQSVFDNLGELRVKSVTIDKGNVNQQGVLVAVEDKKLHEDRALKDNFQEIKRELWLNPENDIAKLTNSDIEEVKKSLKKILKKVSNFHSKYKDSLSYAEGAREAAHHGFIAGALVNFRYRHNLRVYLEQFAGRGYADIVLVPRGKDRSLNSIPIVIEVKAVTKEELEQLRKKGSKIKANSKTTPSAALKQAEDYTKGFQPNVMRVLTTAENILCVGVNLDHPSPISDIVAKSRDQEITPLFNEILISIDGRNNGRVNEEGLKKKVQNNIKRIYHTFPGTGEKGDNHYFSRFLLGQSLLLNEVEVLESNFKKHVFIYGENIPTEAQSEPQSQRLKDQKSKGQGAGQPSRLDQSHGVVTIVLVSKSAQKSVCVMNIVETDGRDNVINKGIPLDKLRQEIGDRRVVELNLNFNVNKQKEKFEEYFSMEIRAPIPLAQYTSGMPDKFQGDFENIPYPDRLKEVFDEALESQLASSQDQSSSQSIDKYKGLFKKLGEAVLPFKVLIEKEAHTQPVLNGTFSHYSDIRLGEPQEEDRALILTEFQTGRGKRIDMLVHGIKFADQAGSAKEYAPVGLEIKGPRKNVTVQRLKQEAVKQIEMYKECVTCKTLTDGNTVAFVGVVFDEKARDAGSLISTTEDFIMGIARHSSILSVEQLQSLHFNREQQEVFSRFVSHNFPNASIAPVKQGLYLPPFEKRGVKIDGKCVSITRSLSQALFSQSNESFLSNLKASSEIYERIAQGKQISKREEREVFAFSKLLSNFERQLDSATSSIPSSLILNTKKDRKAFSDLSNHIAEIEGDFAIHLVTSNHVVAIYRIGDNYAYFDSNVVFVSELKNVDQLMKIVEKAVESAGYKVGEKGFLVEHFDVDKANSQLSDKDRQILAKEIKTEHQLLAEQDDELGLIKINGQELSRVQLYDFGTKINVEGSVPLLINAEMNLSSEKFQDHLDKREVSMTAREYLDHLKDSENVKEIIQATKAIPFMGSKREIEEAEQTRRPKQSLLELAKGTINCILAAVSLTSASRSKSQLPEKVGNEPQTYLNDPTADKQLQRSVS